MPFYWPTFFSKSPAWALFIPFFSLPPAHNWRRYWKDITKEWVFKAEEDFYSADLLLHAGEAPIPDTACFHCQQCAEKYLKAYLQEHDVEFERSHELMPLLLLCASRDAEFRSIKRELEKLNRFAVIVRYPGITIKADTAEEALNSTNRVRKFIRNKLNIK